MTNSPCELGVPRIRSYDTAVQFVPEAANLPANLADRQNVVDGRQGRMRPIAATKKGTERIMQLQPAASFASSRKSRGRV